MGLIQNRVCVNHNGGGYGFYCTQDMFPKDGLGGVALTNSVNHPTIQRRILMNTWEDLFGLRDTGIEDCEPVKEKHEKDFIGLYQVDLLDGVSKTCIIPRNGRLHYENKKLVEYSENLFFTPDNNVVEFVNGGVRINYVYYQKLTL